MVGGRRNADCIFFDFIKIPSITGTGLDLESFRRKDNDIFCRIATTGLVRNDPIDT